jgi:glycosyltransferase involved in cell wall biosynthesis
MDPDLPAYEMEFRLLKACVLLPTYNNAATLQSVLEGILAFTSRVIVVNDGSTDETAQILGNFPALQVVSYPDNRGKGFALRTGFRQALQEGYEYAITLDSDGQHFAKDLPAFLRAIGQNPGSVIIGARNMQQENVPGKSSFGNRFSNFWFWVETGITLPDTQSGYRAYPLKEAAAMRYFTRKYEFEIEAPVRLAWKGLPVISIPVSVYYPPAGERISHFRPFRDFTRISILNTFLTFIAILWIHPRNFIVKLSKKEGWKDLYRQAFRDPSENRNKKAISIAFGIFMGILPVWGFQLAIGIPLALYFKLNKALFLIAANISIFPLTPIIWGLSLWTGKIILGYNDWSFRFRNISLEQFKEAGLSFFLGGTVLAIGSAALAYLFSLLFLKRKK